MMKKQSNANTSKSPRIHRLASVRKQERVSWKSLSRRTGIPIGELKLQENEGQDLRLSTLQKWHQAFNVPIEELVVEPDDRITPSLELKAHLIKVTKTILLLLEQCEDETTKILAKRLFDELIQIMPELKEVGPWPTRNRPRDPNDVPRRVEQQISTDLLPDRVL